MEAPNITYTSIVRGDNTSVSIGGSIACSFHSPYNSITVKFKCTNMSLSSYVIRLCKQGNSIGPYSGTLLNSATNISMNTETTLSFNVNSSKFTEGDGVYIVGLYAQGYNNIWDSTQLFIDVNGLNVVPYGSTGLEVLEESEE